MIVVIPTNRQVNLSYLEPLIEHNANFIIVYDSDGTLTIDHPSFKVYNWAERKKILGKHDPYYPRKNGASRNFGFYLAHKQAEKNEVIIALDDDCVVENKNFPQDVEKVLSPQKRHKLLSKKEHFNILNLYKGVDANVYPRGFPYESRFDPSNKVETEVVESTSHFNLGLWRGVFDVNGIDKIYGPKWAHEEIKFKHKNVLIPKKVLISVCSMNMQFRKEVIPAVFQFPMHVEIINGWKIDRYGDIWGGFLLKRIMDARGDKLTVGAPEIHHVKAGDQLRNIWQEHLAHIVNVEMIKLITDATTGLTKGNYLDIYTQVYDNMRKVKKASPLLQVYLDKGLLPGMNAWIESLL